MITYLRIELCRLHQVSIQLSVLKSFMCSIPEAKTVYENQIPECVHEDAVNRVNENGNSTYS